MSDESYPLTTEGIAAARFGKPKANKFNVAPKAERTHDGVLYGSKAEMEYAIRAIHWLQIGLLVYLQFQPSYRLGPDTVYRADFFEIQDTGHFCAVEVKGFETDVWLAKKKLWKKYGPCELHIVKGGKIVEVIEPDGMKNE